jgi:hypothetical protein
VDGVNMMESQILQGARDDGKGVPALLCAEAYMDEGESGQAPKVAELLELPQMVARIGEGLDRDGQVLQIGRQDRKLESS